MLKEQNRAEEEFLCSCCYCDYEADEIVEMPDCGHRLCLYCFQGYLQQKVAAGADAVHAVCPDQSCNLVVPPKIFHRLLSTQEYARYQQFLLKCYIELSTNAMWCPGKGCNKACQSNTGRTVGVQCECETNFCFTCQKAAHRPLPCEMLEKWAKEV